ncbi:MAG: hypothetical protein QM655_08380 [Nocardioidaceae bacterium]
MTPPLWATLVVSVAGIAAAAAVLLSSRRPRREEARREIDRGLERVDIALTSGGVTRGIDSDLVDLVERGALGAEQGRLTPVGETDEGHLGEVWLISAVRAAGADGLDAVRGEAVRLGYFAAILRLAKRRIIVSPDRVQYAPILVWGPTMAALFLCTMLMLHNPEPGPGLPDWGPALISIGPWLVVPLAQIALLLLQPGYRGRDPRSRLGIDIVEELTARIGPDASQADRVAIGGFAAMTDDDLRRAIMGGAADSAWDARPWRKRVFRASAGDDQGVPLGW